jgi:hypothetical protein
MSNLDSPHIFYPKKWVILGKNRIFATFRFNTQYVFSESGKRFFVSIHNTPSLKRFFASKMSNSDSPHIFTPRETISGKNFHVGGPLLCSM